MQSETQELILREEDLKSKSPVVFNDKEQIDIELVKSFRSSNVGMVGKLPMETQVLILNVLEKGISLDMAARYAMISPKTLKKNIDEGLEEASNYTQEMMDAGIELSDKARFAVECMQRMAKATVDMGTEFYQRCFETGNTHLMMWWLERLDSQTYNLKRKTEVNTNVNVNANAVVEFKFVAPDTLRSAEDNLLYEKRMKSLNTKYIGPENSAGSGKE